ncbi:MAG: hypothetical protein WHT08_08640 [Bryobacteraceae bacterium]
MKPLLLACHAAATLWMTGLSWFVQIVHYPLMAAVPSAAFPAYELQHRRRTTWIVAPLMLAEAALAAWLLLDPSPAVPRLWAAAGAALLALIWISTFAVQVPLHERLSSRFDAGLHRRLVRSHWLRTAAWTLRSALALWWLASA